MFRTNSFLSRAAACLAVLSACGAFAQAPKVAYINMQAVFDSYYKTIGANVEFAIKKKDFMERAQILREEMNRGAQEVKKLEAEAKNDLLSEDARKESARKYALRMERLRVKDMEFRDFYGEGRKELEKTRLGKEEELITEIVDYVRDYCKANGYGVVFDINGKSFNRMPVVLLYPETDDVTTAVVDAINRGHEDELAKVKADLAAVEEQIKATDAVEEEK